MSDTKIKPVKPLAALTPLRPRARLSTGTFVPWKTMPPKGKESVRWECIDGRWVTIELGHAEHAGKALVRNAAGKSEYVDSFEAALELAKEWRTI